MPKKYEAEAENNLAEISSEAGNPLTSRIRQGDR